LLNFEDPSVLDSFVEQELENPSPRKQVGDNFVYASRMFRWPNGGDPVLSDFGSAESGDAQNTRNAGPDLYRAPEVILGMKWGYKVDIWNVGVMVCCPNYQEVDKLLTFRRSGTFSKAGHYF
jgi:serine/threonine-protein kinase SRPK3